MQESPLLVSREVPVVKVRLLLLLMLVLVPGMLVLPLAHLRSV